MLNQIFYYPSERKLLTRTRASLLFAAVWLIFGANGQTLEIVPITNSSAQITMSGESVQERLAKVRNEFSRLEATTDMTTSRSSTAAVGSALRYSWLQRLIRLYEQQISYTSELELLRKRTAELTAEARTWNGFGPRPYSIVLSDELRESIQVERQEIVKATTALSMLDELIEEHRVSLKQSEEGIRRLNEELERSEQTNSFALDGRRDLERLGSQTSAASIGALDAERAVRKERLAASRVHLGLLEKQLIIANAGTSFTDADMRIITGRLDVEQRTMETELAAAETRQKAALAARDAALEEWRRIQSTRENSAAVLKRGEEVLALRGAELEVADNSVSLLHFILQAGTAERIIWEARFASYRNTNDGLIRDAERRMDQFGRRTDLWQSYYREQLESASSQVALQEARLASLPATAEIAPLLQERLSALRERDALLLRVGRSIDRTARLLLRSKEDLQSATEHLPFSGRLRNAVSNSESWLSRLWHLELFTAQDTITIDGQKITGTRSITLGKVISVILIVLFGYWLTGLLARVSEPHLAKRFNVDRNQARLVRRWVRVLLIFCLTIFGLLWVKIPLTVFAFSGGALMIALGFGLQTLLKNFVSGIIILFERPFRVGDVLDVGGQRGTVVSIGTRSSVLQLWDNTEMLIPNSTLLENSVTNWTYSDHKVRFCVNVGVAYGCDTRRVVQLLTEIAERHGLVEKNPAPQIFFVNFGESALQFELRVWADVLKANAAQVCSDLRQMIAITFAEQGIVIAIPQRDIHLAARPLQVQVLPSPRTMVPTVDGEKFAKNGPGTLETAPRATESPIAS